MYRWLLLLIPLLSCRSSRKLSIAQADKPWTGTQFYRQTLALGWAGRDSVILERATKGNIPSFLKKLQPVTVSIKDSVSQKTIRATFYVSSDYFSIGTDQDWARVPVTARTAKQLLEKMDCVAPTTKLVDVIYEQAVVKLEPVPMYAYRDSTATMWHHHLIIEGQRKGRRGLISGIKKDIVFMKAPGDSVRADRVGIYGWHKPDHRPIQPFYQGHVWWYADYSHGLRLVSKKVKVGHRVLEIQQLLDDPVLRQFLF